MYVGAAPSLAHKFKTASCIHVGALKNPFLGEVRRLDAERPREGLHGQAVEELGGVDVGVDREIERFPSSSSVNCILMLQCTLPHCAPTSLIRSQSCTMKSRDGVAPRLLHFNLPQPHITITSLAVCLCGTVPEWYRPRLLCPYDWSWSSSLTLPSSVASPPASPQA